MMKEIILKLMICIICLAYCLIPLLTTIIKYKIEIAVTKRVGSTAAKFHNSTDEDDNGSRIVLPLSSEMHVNGTKTPFNCSNITLKERKLLLFTSLWLDASNFADSSNMTRECKSYDEIIVEYSTCSSIVTSFMHCTISLICAWAFIISLPKFVVMVLILIVFIYFWTSLILTGSLSNLLVYYLPIHVNFFFFLFTGWITILSCKAVFDVVKSHGILRVSNGEIVGNSFYIFIVTFVISCVYPIITFSPIDAVLVSRTCIVHSGNSLSECVYYQMTYMMLDRYSFPMILVAVLVIQDWVQMERMQDSEVRHTKYRFMFYFYYLFAKDLWAYGSNVLSYPDYPYLWRLYFFVAMALPIVFLIDVMTTAKVRISFLVERSRNLVEIDKIRVQGG